MAVTKHKVTSHIRSSSRVTKLTVHCTTCGWSLTKDVHPVWGSTEGKRQARNHRAEMTAREEGDGIETELVGTVKEGRGTRKLYLGHMYGLPPPGMSLARQKKLHEDNMIYRWVVWEWRKGHSWHENKMKWDWYPTPHRSRYSAYVQATTRLEAHADKGKEVTLAKDLDPMVVETLTSHTLVIKEPAPTFDEYLKQFSEKMTIGRTRNKTSALKQLRALRSYAEMALTEIEKAEKAFMDM